MTYGSHEGNTRRNGNGCSVAHIRYRKHALVSALILLSIVASAIIFISLDTLDSEPDDYKGKAYTVTYHESEDGTGEKVTVTYRGSFVSTEYNPQFWKDTIEKSGGIVDGSYSDWKPIGVYQVNTTEVFAGWNYRLDFAETGDGFVGTVDPGDVLSNPPTTMIHLFANWDTLEYISVADSSTTLHTAISQVLVGGNPYTSIVLVDGTQTFPNQLDKPVTIRGTGSAPVLDAGYVNHILNSDVIIDRIRLNGSHQSDNHGDGSGGIFANGHKLIIGTGVDTRRLGSVTDVKGYPQLFGGGTRNGITDTSLIVHSGIYGNIFGGSGSGGAGIGRDTKVVLRNVTVLDTLAGGSARDAGNIKESTWIYATALYMPGDYYEEKELGYSWKDSLPKLTESTIITGGSNGTGGGQVGGSTHVLLSGISEVWDVQGGGRRGGTVVTKTSNVEISGNAVVKHIACGGITDGQSFTTNVKDVHLIVKDDARVAMLLGGGYDTWGSPGTGSTISGNITIEIKGGTVGYVYGGGFRGVVGSLETAVNISIEGGTVLQDVYGGGRGGFDKILHENSGALKAKEESGFKDTTGYSMLTAKSIDITVGKDAVVRGSVYGGGQSTPVINSYNGETGLQGKYHNGQLLNVAEVVAGSVGISIEGTVNGSVYTGGKGIDTSLFTDTASPEYMEWTKIIGMKDSGELGYISWFKSTGGSSTTSDTVNFDTGDIYGNFASSTSTAIGSSRSVTMTDGTIGGSVYGGGAIGITETAGTISVDVEGGTVSGSVYGGGMGHKDNTGAGKVQAGGIAVTLDASTTEPTINGSVYGGGAIGTTDIGTGMISVAVNSGTVSGSVYGGGMGLKGNTEAGKVQAGLINVTIGTPTTEPTIKGSVYGGGAYSFTVSEIAVVINNGNVYGNVFSGGLGTSNSQTINSQSTAGKRTLNMSGGRVKGSVYGSSSYGNDGKEDTKFTTSILISAGRVDGSVYGGGFKGETYGDTSIEVEGKASIGMSVYGGADVGVVTGAFVEETKVIGNSTISIDGTDGASVAGSVFGSGNSCLVKGTKTIHIKGLNSGTAMASIQNADKVDIEGSRLILAGRAAGTSSSATTKYSLNNIGVLNLADGTYMELRARVNDIGEYHSRVAVNGADTSSSNPKNTIRLAEGRSFEVRNTDGYQKIHGYTILSLNPAELYYGAFAYGSNESPGGFVIEREGTYIKADTQDFGDKCRLWFISGTVLRTTTLVATNTGPNTIEAEEHIHRISADTYILYTGHVLSVSQTSNMRLVEGAPATEGEYRLTFGYQGTDLMTFGEPDKGIRVFGMFSVKEVVGEGGGSHVGFRLEYFTPKYSGFAGTVHLSFIEAVQVTLAGGETGYLHQNRIDYRIDVYTDASGGFGGDYTVPVVLHGGSGSGEFVIPRSFYEHRLVLESFDLSGMPGASLTIAPSENNEGSLGWAHPLGDPVGPSANSVIGTLTGSFNSTLLFAISNGSENQRAVLNFSLEHDIEQKKTFTVVVTTENVRMLTVEFVDYEHEYDPVTSSYTSKEIRRTATVPYGSVIPASAVPPTGNGFIGWFEDENLKKAFNLSQPVTNNRTAYAGYKYTVTFDLMNGKTLKDYAEFPVGSKVYKPEVQREGYDFKGWYRDKELTVKAFVDENGEDRDYEEIVKDTTFYAKWKGVDVTVTFLFKGDEEKEWTLKYEYGQLYGAEFPENDTFDSITAEAKKLAEKYGMDFVRWELARENPDGSLQGQKVYVYGDMELLEPSPHILLADCRDVALKVDLIGEYIDSNGETIPEDRRFGDISIDAPKSILVFEEKDEFRFTPSNATTTGYSLHEWRLKDPKNPEGASFTVDAGIELVFKKKNGNGFILVGTDYTISSFELKMETCWKAITYEVHIQEPAGGTVELTTDPKYNLMKVPYGTTLSFVYTPGGPYVLRDWVLSGEGNLISNGNTCTLYVTGNCLIYLRLGGSYRVDVALEIDKAPAPNETELMLKSGNRERPLIRDSATGQFYNSTVETGYYELYIKDKSGSWLKIDEDILIQDDRKLEYSLYSIDVVNGNNVRIDKNLVSYPDYSISERDIVVQLPTEGYNYGTLTTVPTGLGSIDGSEISFKMPNEKTTLKLDGFEPMRWDITFIYNPGEPGFDGATGDITREVVYGSVHPFPVPNVWEGWDFSRWEWIDNSGTMVKQYKDKQFLVEIGMERMRAVWNHGTIDYTVEKYRQLAVGDGYELVSETTVSGTAGSHVDISGDPVDPGFHLNENHPGSVLAAELKVGLVLRAYYDRDTYEVTTKLKIDPVKDFGPTTMRYGAPWNPDLYKEIPFGYNIEGWYRNEGLSGTPTETVPLGTSNGSSMVLYMKGIPYTYKVIYDPPIADAPKKYVYGSGIIDLNGYEKPIDPEGRPFEGWTLNDLPLVDGIIDSQFLKDADITPERELRVNAVSGYLISVEQPPVGEITVSGEVTKVSEGKYTVSRNKNVQFSYDSKGTKEKVFRWHINKQSMGESDSIEFSIDEDVTVGVVLKLRAEGFDPGHPYPEHSFVGMFNSPSDGYVFESDPEQKIEWIQESNVKVGGFIVDFSTDERIILHAPDALGIVSIGHIIHQDSSGNYHHISLTAIIVSGIYPTEET